MECGDCTLCCKLLDISWMDSPVNQYCQQCNIDIGCSIFENAPQKCLDFSCGYNEWDKVSEGLRPDKCGVIFEKITENIFHGLQDPDTDMTDIAGRQINSFLQQGFSVYLTTPFKEESTIYVAEGDLAKDIYSTIQNLIKERNGSI